ncbi:hypothetical protein HY3_08730 [Hyphomonas pacifica]|uniref:Uncharacterized protein n=1 Tax=Hyphomonas pacifica TaxID=1280941 RepID=A0A062TXW0_9PROT|nr:hypothetical protein HY2_07205 [Hyphomonas pacifica]RAN35374.1 hypothetical protein HY3_08730 [Hyphomonas pacifica]RAN38233.1 hypothetical protein HY11_00035 [Hyphomonas pacifica]
MVLRSGGGMRHNPFQIVLSGTDDVAGLGESSLETNVLISMKFN